MPESRPLKLAMETQAATACAFFPLMLRSSACRDSSANEEYLRPGNMHALVEDHPSTRHPNATLREKSRNKQASARRMTPSEDRGPHGVLGQTVSPQCQRRFNIESGEAWARIRTYGNSNRAKGRILAASENAARAFTSEATARARSTPGSFVTGADSRPSLRTLPPGRPLATLVELADKGTREIAGVELLEVVKPLPYADLEHGKPQFMRHGQRDAAFGRAVQLRDDHAV